MSVAPRLVTVAHGTRTASGNLVAAELTRLTADRLGLEAVTSYVELCEPLLADVLKSSAAPTVVVPLLLSTGFHLRQDLPAAVAGAGGPAFLGRSLGPHALLADAQVEQLVAAGARPGQPLVMVAAGSSDVLATRDLDRAAELLARAWGGPVRVATLSGLGQRVEDVVRPGDCVSTYLLAGGYFARKAATLARDAGARAVADVIGPHPRVVDLVVRRADALIGAGLLGV
ncbi:Sirohydrochlorin ferrochelatase [Nocardioides scoriae]|uniref:Sirohydrochlorin ferrochelatase n=1 Tax=Nocardioides scoriae TaxID=642780 RepID=A0A1H1X8Y6_9ACTN|nr:CbiX/SirB N-terminal domain-containing protein [Nocardioides scoriae]SDT05785.1 Sirohydrochlorin ferrochelatase [Nocardioides scoriae]